MEKPRRLIIFIIVIIIVIGLSAGVALLLVHYNNSSTNNQSNQQQASTSKALSIQSVTDSASKLAAKGDVSGGVKSLDSAISSTSDEKQKAIYYSSKATILLNGNDPSDALTAATQAFNLQKTSDSAAFVGQIERTLGNTQQALSYYKQALSLIDPSDPFAKDDTAYYQGIINDLGKG